MFFNLAKCLLLTAAVIFSSQLASAQETKKAETKEPAKDDGEWIQWNDISHQDQTWHWDDLRPFESRADRFMVPFSEGPHMLQVSYRELGAKLDRLVIASELDWVPTE